MKRWQAVVSQLALVAAGAYMVPKIQDPQLQLVVVGAVLTAAGATAHKTSSSNPDGTPAQRPWGLAQPPAGPMGPAGPAGPMGESR